MMKSIQAYMLPCVIFFFLGWTLSPTEIKEVIKEKTTNLTPQVSNVSNVSNVSRDQVVSQVIVDIPKEVAQAKEYYEKAFLLFLANLGLQLSREEEKSFEALIENPQNYLAKSPGPFRDRLEKSTVEGSRQNEPQESGAYVTVRPKDFNLDSLPSEFKKRALTQILKDPAVFHARSQYLKKFNEVQRLVGEYKGQLFLIAGENAGRVDQVYLKIDFERGEEGKINGEFSLQLFNGTKVYSNANGSGGNGNVRFYEETLLIEGGPGRFFHFKNGQLKTARLYDNGTYIGFATFNRI